MPACVSLPRVGVRSPVGTCRRRRSFWSAPCPCSMRTREAGGSHARARRGCTGARRCGRGPTKSWSRQRNSPRRLATSGSAAVQIERAALRLYVDLAIEARQVLGVAERATPVFEASGDKVGLCAHGCWWPTRTVSLADEMLEDILERRTATRSRWVIATRGRGSWARLPRRAGRAAACRRGDPPLPRDSRADPDEPTSARHRLDGGGARGLRGRFAARARQPTKLTWPSKARSQRPTRSVPDVCGWVELLAGDAAAAERRVPSRIPELERMGEQSYLSTTAAFLALPLPGEVRRGGAPDRGSGHEATSDDDLISQATWRGTRAKVLAEAERRGRRTPCPRISRSLVRDRLPEHAGRRPRRPRGDTEVPGHGDGRAFLLQAIERYEAKGNVVSASRRSGALVGRAARRA